MVASFSVVQPIARGASSGAAEVPAVSLSQAGALGAAGHKVPSQYLSLQAATRHWNIVDKKVHLV